MGVLEKTSGFVELITLDKETSHDMYAKYALLADAYFGSAGMRIVTDNKDTFNIILSQNIVDFVCYLYRGGSLSSEIASNPNLGKLLQEDKSINIRTIIKELEADNGFKTRKEVSINDIKDALSYWGLQESTEDAESDADILAAAADEAEADAANFNFDNADDLLNKAGSKEETSSEDDDEEDEGEAEDYGEEEDYEDELNKLAGELTESAKKELELVAEAEKVIGDDKEIKEFDEDNADTITQQITDKDKKFEEYIDRKRRDAAEKAIEDSIDKNSEVDKAIVNKTVRSIMSSYDVLYPHLFQETPSGILTAAGIVTVKKDNSLQVMGDGNAYAIRLYQSMMSKYGSVINEYDYHNEISMECINPDGTLKYNYAPNFHIRNIYGIYRSEKDNTLKRETNWNSFRLKLIKSLTKTVTKLLSEFKGDQLILSMNIVELFTTVFIMEDFDIAKSLKFTAKSIAISNKFGDCSDVGKMISDGGAIPIDRSSLEVVNNAESEMGVHNLLVVFDKKIYNGEILFAYKPLKRIIESGGRIGLQKTLIGRGIKGKNVTFNFESPQVVDSLVIAGSGSGKGVVTLNMLATFIAEGCPTVYVDWKPEMAAMLWNLERSTGARILSIDGLAGNMEGITPVRNYGIGKNMPKIPNVSDKLNVIPYVKAFQIMILCARGRNMGYNGMTSQSKKMQFIMDEAQAMNKQLSALREATEHYIKANKPKKGESVPDEVAYANRLSDFLESLFSGATQFRNTTGRTGNIGLIMLGQQSDCTAWATGALKRDPFGFLVGNCSMKLLGKDATDSNKYSLNGCVPAGNSYLGNMGYFALVNQAVADKSAPEKIDVIKTYLVLNENDYSESGPGKFTGGLLKNVTDPVLRQTLIDDDLYPIGEDGERHVNPLVGFKGLVEYIGSTIPGFDLKKNLEAGYVEVEKLLAGLGIVGENGAYSCIEEYIFDCSYNGLFTVDELAQLMQHGETIADLIDIDGPNGGGGDNGGGGGFGETPRGSFSVGGDDGDETRDAESRGGTGGEGYGDYTDVRPSVTSKFDARQVDESQLPRDVVEMMKRRRAATAAAVGDGVGQTSDNNMQQEVEDGQTFGQGQQGQGQHWQGQQRNVGNMTQGEEEEFVNAGYTERPRQGIDYSGEAAQPGFMPPSEEKVFQFGGSTGRVVYVTPNETTKVLGLTKDNSVLVAMPEYDTTEKFSGRLFKSLWGSQYEFKNRWRTILDGVANKKTATTITRATILEDAIVFNKKMVATLNILGGEEDIRIEDIVDFKMTAKRFINIREIILDMVIFERAQAELADPINQLFNLFKELNKLCILENGCGAPKIYVTRSQVMQGRVEEKAQRAAEKAKFKNQMEAVSAAKNPSLHTKSPGYQNKVWEASKQFQGVGWSSARDALLDKNPKLFKAAGMSIATIAVLGVGLTFGAVGRIGSLFRR